ncbi:glycoside hydrolase family 127 protein, partial [Staphylococcus aureus]|nr:glycoside hydrolase family 127 protein [Staphylococcus aureus]
EATGDDKYHNAAAFFWRTVAHTRAFATGGHGDAEHFFAMADFDKHVFSAKGSETCCQHNMLKLTRHLYGWQPDGRLFDYYERAHLNHVMAAQHPVHAGFTYMTPLMTGMAREFSTDKDDAFWCCVGSGMESHAKHGESIFWQGGDTLFVNLYIPAEARWDKRGAVVTLDTAYPMDGAAKLAFSRLDRAGRFPVALRVPGWANGQAAVEVNGQPVTPVFERGYAVVDRRWKTGDTVAIRL